MRRVSTSLTLAPASRMGCFAIALYQDHDGNITQYPVSGGSIRYSQYNGEGTVWRLHDLAYPKDGSLEKYDKKLISLWADWRKLLRTEIIKLQVEAKTFVNYKDNPKGDNNLVRFGSRWELEKFLEIKILRAAIRIIYDMFPIDLVRKHESFYIWTFAASQETPLGDKAPVIQQNLDVDGWDTIIVQPRKSLAGKTAIRFNKGCWEALCMEFGFKYKMSGELFEFFWDQFVNQKSKVSDVTDTINLLGRKNNSPVDYQVELPEDQSKPFYVPLDYLIAANILIEVWNLCNQNLRLEDWKELWEWRSFIPNLSNEAMEQLWAAYTKTWGETQVRYPEGDLAHVADRFIFPFTRAGQPLDLESVIEGWVDDEDPEYDVEPYLTLCQLDVDHPNKAIDYHFVRLRCINDCDAEVMVAYNRSFGSYHSTQLDVDAFGRWGLVYPAELYEEKPVKKHMKLNKMNYSVVMDTVDAVDPFLKTNNPAAHFLFNQGCITGPNFYLVDIGALVEKSADIKINMYDFSAIAKAVEEEQQARELLEKTKSEELSKMMTTLLDLQSKKEAIRKEVSIQSGVAAAELKLSEKELVEYERTRQSEIAEQAKLLAKLTAEEEEIMGNIKTTSTESKQSPDSDD